MGGSRPQYLFRIYGNEHFLGTGVLVSKRHLLTCAHVVESAKKVSVRGENIEENADVIGVSPEDQHDLALLQLPRDLQEPLGWSHQVALGKEVQLMGFAKGADGDGNLRSIPDHANPQYDSNGWVECLHVEAGAAPGMSGGVATALFGAEVRYVGLIREGGKRSLRSLLAGAAPIAVFLAGHGVRLPGCPEFVPVVAVDDDEAVRKRYLAELFRRTAQIDIRGFQRSDGKASAFPIEDLYIPLSNPAKEDIEASAGKHRCLVVQGDAGSGKSTLLQSLAHKLAGGGRHLPLPIRVVELDRTIHKEIEVPGTPVSAEDPRWLAVHLAAVDWTQDLGIDEAFLVRQLRRAETVVLLDGLDEALNDARRRGLVKLFSRAADKYRQCRFVVTTRPGGYEGQGRELFAMDSIAPLGDEARAQFFDKWYRCAYPENPTAAKSQREDLERQVAGNEEVQQMADNPMMLTALAAIHWNDKRLPEDRGELYQSVIRWLAQSRETRPGRVSAKKCLEVLGALAFGMQTWTEGRLKQADGDTAAKILWESAKMPAREARDFLAQEELDSGIIVSRGEGMREFRHLTFQEYLAALELLENKSEAEQEEILRDRRRYSVEWREFLRLFAILIRPRRAQGLYSTLLEAAGEPLADRARTVALIRTLAADRREKEGEIEDPQYLNFVRQMAGLFEGKADGQGLDLWSRGVAAEAWELLIGDTSHLRIPSDADYWERFAVSGMVFEVGRFPVTVHEYSVYLDACPKVDRPPGWEEQGRFPHRPVVYVSFHDAENYCAWWSRQTGRIVRLPAEEEWYLAAAGVAHPPREYPWGDEEPSHDQANYGYELRRVSPVGLFPMGAARGTGIQDMAGNAWEWTSSLYEKGQRYMVLRGGSFNDDAWYLRAAFRGYYDPDGRFNVIGFRCVREVSS